MLKVDVASVRPSIAFGLCILSLVSIKPPCWPFTALRPRSNWCTELTTGMQVNKSFFIYSHSNIATDCYVWEKGPESVSVEHFSIKYLEKCLICEAKISFNSIVKTSQMFAHFSVASFFLETLCCCYVLHLYPMYWVIKHFLTLYCITKYDILAWTCTDGSFGIVIYCP